jgi:hypothetical protein
LAGGQVVHKTAALPLRTGVAPQSREQHWKPYQQSQPQARTAAFSPATDETTAAQQRAAALKAVSVRNPAWWAENKRRIYLPLLRWQLADGTSNHAALAMCCYQLNLFADWERQLKAQGITPAREIEKALRWDGVTCSCAGMGNQMVRDYLKAHPEAAADVPGK